jgi:uncharacterized protein (TIGR02996 family)
MTDEHATFLKAIIARPDLDLPRLVYADWLEGTAGQKPCPACPELGYGNEPEWTTEIPLYWCGQCDQATRSVPNGHAERAEFIRVQCELAKTPRWESSECKVCGATPDSEGEIRHGKGCYRLSEDGGGEEYADENPRWTELRCREAQLLEWASAKNAPWWPSTAFRFDSAKFVRGFVESIACSWSDWRTHADAIMAVTPLRRVRLTTWPAGAEGYDAQRVKLYCERAYRGIEFELPQLVDGVPV